MRRSTVGGRAEGPERAAAAERCPLDGSVLGVVAHYWFGEGAGVPFFDAPPVVGDGGLLAVGEALADPLVE